MTQEKLPLRIRYEYQEAPDARPQYAHGVWGGINAQGEVEINFYAECDKLPPFSERLVAPDGSFGHEMAPCDENMKLVTRHILSRIIVNYNTACDIVEWLEDKIQVLDMEADGAPYPFEEGEPDPEQ
jgi:hypothetical protein